MSKFSRSQPVALQPTEELEKAVHSFVDGAVDEMLNVGSSGDYDIRWTVDDLKDRFSKFSPKIKWEETVEGVRIAMDITLRVRRGVYAKMNYKFACELDYYYNADGSQSYELLNVAVEPVDITKTMTDAALLRLLNKETLYMMMEAA